ncbi:response regulator [Arcticibacter sp. MXS-1]|uniref:response regulator n=1 Tax=Arcticibacter sp. MXS-1 TaxID=3341726 RepID=UPI0035A8C7A1
MEIKVAIADDHLLIIGGLSSMLKKNKKFQLIFSATSGPELFLKLRETLPDVLFLDIQLPGLSGIEICKIVKQDYPSVRIIALTNHEESHFVKQMLRNGASGYLLKNTDGGRIAEAVEQVMQGGQYIDQVLQRAMLDELLSGKKKTTAGVMLTKREQEILGLIAQEYSNQEIADKLFISLRTVETHRLNISQKLNVKNTVGLVKEAYQRGLI